jgi:hypothetical protein
MKFDKMPFAEVRPKDCKAVVEALDILIGFGVEVRRSPKNAFQLKLSEDLSYYPTTGRIFRDGDDSALERTGIEALLGLLMTEGVINAPTPHALIAKLDGLAPRRPQAGAHRMVS